MSNFDQVIVISDFYKKQLETCRLAYKQLEDILLKTVEQSAGRELALCLTKLQESSFFANRAIALNAARNGKDD